METVKMTNQEKPDKILVTLRGELLFRVRMLARRHNLSMSNAIQYSLLHSPIGEGLETVLTLQHYLLDKVFVDEWEALTAKDVHEVLLRRGLTFCLSSVRTELSRLTNRGKLKAHRIHDSINGKVLLYSLNMSKYSVNR